MKQDVDTKRHVADYETLIADVLDLRAYCLVADLRSFTGAAKVMGESKGTISRRVARLEEALGATLLVRSPRSVETTDDGAAYRLRVGQVLELLGDANLTARRSHGAPSGHLRVTAPTDLSIGMLAAPIARFAKAYPDVHVEMVVTDRVLDLDKENIDVALRASLRLPDSDLIAHKLFDICMVAVASPEYLRENEAPKRPEELDQHRIAFLGSTRGRRKLPMRRADARGTTEIELRPAIGASDFAFIKEVALAGVCLAIIPSVLITGELASGRLVRVLPRMDITGGTLHLIHRGERFLPPKVRAFVDHMLREVGPPAKAAPVTR
jgi:DNA-binding transcriptional LysR family regulator